MDSQRKIKIAAVGSCISRDPFNSLFNKDWKQYFEFTAYQFQGSMISLMSPPISYDVNEFQWEEHVPKATRWALYSELNKAFLSDLYHAQPDYLIIDLYADVFYGMCQLDNTFIMNKTNALRYNSYLKKQKKISYSCYRRKKQFFALFEQKMDDFMRYCHHYLPATKIILNQARFQAYYIDEQGKRHLLWRYPKPYLTYLNRCWCQLEEKIISKYDVLTLNHDNKVYYAAQKHPFGDKFPLHYTPDFYRDFQQKLLNLVKNDQRENKGIEECYNLIQNHDFHLQTASWQGFQHEAFTVLEDGTLDVCAFDNTENIYCALASYPMLLRRGEKYHFSFEFHPIDLSMMKDDDPVCYIRTYHQPEKIIQKWASYHRKITKKEVLNYLKEKQTTTFELTLTLKEGKFIKLLPYMLKNGHYQFKNMMCYIDMDQKPQPYTINEMLFKK